MLTGIAGACMAAVMEDDTPEAKGAAFRPADTTNACVQGAVTVEIETAGVHTKALVEDDTAGLHTGNVSVAMANSARVALLRG